LGALGIDGRMILKSILKKQKREREMNSSDAGQRSVADP
jgi:hypothetical protein